MDLDGGLGSANMGIHDVTLWLVLCLIDSTWGFQEPRHEDFTCESSRDFEANKD